MNKRNTLILLTLSLLFWLLVEGCASRPAAPASTVSRSGSRDISWVHWVGIKQVAASTNTCLMGIWKQPESIRLANQTLDKLSTAPWRLLRGATTNTVPAASGLLRPLLDDVVNEESYVEIRHRTNHTDEMVFAIRLEPSRAALWNTNLAAVLESLTEIQPSLVPNQSGWALVKHEAPDRIQLVRVGQWTVIGMASETNGLFAELQRRIERHRVPFRPASTNHWLEADVDVARLGQAFLRDWQPPEGLPRVTACVTNEAGFTRVQADLAFPQPLTFQMEPWQVPTNLVDGSFVGFTAVQGIQKWVGKWTSSWGLHMDPAPNQFFMWSLPGLPAQTLFAAPLVTASNQIPNIATRIMEVANPVLALREEGNIVRAEDNNGAAWQGMPFMTPFIEASRLDGKYYISGGSLGHQPIVNPLLPESFQSLMVKTNVVYFDREQTGWLIDTWLYIGQRIRVVMGRQQLTAEHAGTQWLKSAEWWLSECFTTIAKTGPATLSFTRRSELGLSSIDLHLLVDWLESPDFPVGFYTLRTPAEVVNQ